MSSYPVHTKRRDAEKLAAARERGTHTKEEWHALISEFHNRCVRCLRRFQRSQLTKDHIIPVSKEGSDSIENIQPMCAPCNNHGKKAKATDYRQLCRAFLDGATKRQRKELKRLALISGQPATTQR